MLAKASCKRTPLQPGRRPGQLFFMLHDPWSIIHWTVDKDNLICACKADRNRRPARPTGLGEGERQKRRALLCSAGRVRVCISKSRRPSGVRTPPLLPPCFFSFRPFTLAKRALLASARSSCIHDNGSSREQHRSRSVAATGRQQRPVHSTIAAGTPAVLASLDDVARSELSRQGSRTALLALPATRVWCDTRNASYKLLVLLPAVVCGETTKALFLAGACVLVDAMIMVSLSVHDKTA